MMRILRGMKVITQAPEVRKTSHTAMSTMMMSTMKGTMGMVTKKMTIMTMGRITVTTMSGTRMTQIFP